VALASYVALAVPLVILVLGRHWWFYWDEWGFLSERDVSVDGLFQPHNHSHLTALPVLVYRGLWNVVGARSYRPYQVPVLLLHLGIVSVLYALMRRSGVRSSIAAAAAATLVLFSPGRFNIVWGFEMSFNAATFFFLLQVLLLERPGPLARRDVFGLLCGFLGVLSAGTSVAMLVAVGTVALLRRGWRVAAFHVLPLLGVLAAWWVAFDAATVSPGGTGPADAAMTVRWVRWAFQGTFGALGYWTPLAVGLALLALVGLAQPARAAVRALGGGTGRLDRLRAALDRHAVPLGLLVAALAYAVLTARGRWWLGRSASTSSQNLHLLAVLTLPIIAAGAEACASRWRSAVLVAVALLLVPVPFNARGFRGGRTTPDYFAESRLSVLSTAVNPLSAMAEPEHHPAWWEREMSFGMDVGFLLDAAADGRLDPLPELDEVQQERSNLQLALRRLPTFALPPVCETVEAPTVLTVGSGVVIQADSVVRLSLADSVLDEPPSVSLSPLQPPVRPVVEGLRIRLEPSPTSTGPARVRICR
jgi:hypothetical protein